MCGRYVSPEEAEIERFWHIGRHNIKPFGRRFNVSPTSMIPILRLDRSTGEIIKAKQPHFFHLPADQLFLRLCRCRGDVEAGWLDKEPLRGGTG
jgi:hypothetical protein